jgi:hypothetical protein
MGRSEYVLQLERQQSECLVPLIPMPTQMARAPVLAAALPAGFFSIPLELRHGFGWPASGPILIASSIFGALTLAAAIYLAAGSK